MKQMIAGNPILLTPGPLTTTLRTRQAMLTDWGSWDDSFKVLTEELRRELLAIANGSATHVCVPLQGSGTFAVEAAIGTLVPRDGKVLVPVNGAYCKRLVKILTYLGRAHVTLDAPEDGFVSPRAIGEALANDSSITHVAQVHCETGTGILNPLPEIAEVVAKHGRGLIVDAMSSFGAIDVDLARMPVDALVSASGKCLEGVPGLGFVILRRAALEKSEGRCHSLAMDLYDQWVYMEKTGQFRYTPPTHVVAALVEAVRQFKEEGGRAARGARYANNCATLIEGMTALGFRTFLKRELQAPIIVTFHAPNDANYNFKDFYARVRDKGFILYPGKLTEVETFRVGCIGAIGETEMRAAVDAISRAVKEMGIREMGTRTTAPAAVKAA
jgi:2-aminoethylphosphonate-pyruvate transaminase